SNTWEMAVFDLTGYAGDTVNIRFHFGSDSWVTESGWYVDDVWVGYVDSTGIHDVGVLSLSLPDTVYENSSYTPGASIYNYGVEELPFPVVCYIGDYIDTVYTDLQPGIKLDVEFGEWIPDVHDTTLTAIVETRLRGDWAPSNDAYEKDVYVCPPHGTSLGENKPKVYALYQGRPNPFGDIATIRYAIPRKGEVSLDIYNILGQSVIQLVSGVKEPGYYDVRWDGRDSRGKKVSGGIYFVKFSSGDFYSIKKIVKVR
ncbi:T9SS type A sorting domain-containing protein, partial [candidate division WOR-3 bacterium]|nr:T9SS type A sorting domain-containing protein [candidate division WOR-3 bacterium]